jgi:hypothetical protein
MPSIVVTNARAFLNAAKKTISSAVKPTTTGMIAWVTDITNKFNTSVTQTDIIVGDLQAQIDDISVPPALTLSVNNLTLPSNTTVSLNSANTTVSYDLSVDTIDCSGDVNISTSSITVQSLPTGTLTTELLPDDLLRIVRDGEDFVIPAHLVDFTFPPYVPTAYNWVSDGDTNSIIDFLGGSPYTNPVSLGKLIATTNMVASDPNSPVVLENLFDKDDGYWTGTFDSRSNTGNQWVMLDFPLHPVKPNRLVLKDNDFDPNNFTDSTNNITGIIFQGSNDGSTWTDLHAIATPTSPYYNSGAITSPAFYRYVRLLKSNASTYWLMSELQIYGEY